MNWQIIHFFIFEGEGVGVGSVEGRGGYASKVVEIERIKITNPGICLLGVGRGWEKGRARGGVCGEIRGIILKEKRNAG